MAQIGQKEESVIDRRAFSSGPYWYGSSIRRGWPISRTRILVGGSRHGKCDACGCHDMRNRMDSFKERVPRIVEMRALNW